MNIPVHLLVLVILLLILLLICYTFFLYPLLIYFLFIKLIICIFARFTSFTNGMQSYDFFFIPPNIFLNFFLTHTLSAKYFSSRAPALSHPPNALHHTAKTGLRTRTKHLLRPPQEGKTEDSRQQEPTESATS